MLLACRIVLVEAAEMLGAFDARLRHYAANKLVKAGVHLKKGMVKKMSESSVMLQAYTAFP